jgi:hypothetical protein
VFGSLDRRGDLVAGSFLCSFARSSKVWCLWSLLQQAEPEVLVLSDTDCAG